MKRGSGSRPRTHLAVANHSRPGCGVGGFTKLTVDVARVTCKACQKVAKRDAAIGSIAELVALGLNFLRDDAVFKAAQAVQLELDFGSDEGLRGNVAVLERALRRAFLA